MSIELVCDNCGQRKVVQKDGDFKGWDWINHRVGDAAYTFGAFGVSLVQCPDCQRAVERARVQAAKEALSIRAVKRAKTEATA